jgi:hypothetical protein
MLLLLLQSCAGVPAGHFVIQRDSLDPGGVTGWETGQGSEAAGRSHGSSQQVLLWGHVRVLLKVCGSILRQHYCHVSQGCVGTCCAVVLSVYADLYMPCCAAPCSAVPCRWLNGHKTMLESGFVLKQLEKYCRSHCKEMLQLAAGHSQLP